MNEKRQLIPSILICGLAGLLQGLTVLQQCVYRWSLEMFAKSRSDR